MFARALSWIRTGTLHRRLAAAAALGLLAAVAAWTVLRAGLAASPGTTPGYGATTRAPSTASPRPIGGVATPAPGPDPSADNGGRAQGGAVGGAEGGSRSPGGAPGVIVVDVQGAVGRPGLVTLSAGARVADAIRAAGGLAPGSTSSGVNLAAPLHDGDQVMVGPAPQGGVRPADGSGGSGGSTGPVDVNSATAAQLDALPGIGPTLAGRIVAYRQAHGRFASVDALRQVPGIGDHLLASLRDLVVVR